uniref:Uncharacterized protein n=1 Tax=Euplotes harpa TaxID=151035 RepID=A0A7S3JBZ1_9SPIT|mmetsp:Transcript_31845/g.36362  ORF Transcript_31845/g.36362 Transcript_31845/m.36362 type:complete len:168 (+) Transcript_31845:25-528(+)
MYIRLGTFRGVHKFSSLSKRQILKPSLLWMTKAFMSSSRAAVNPSVVKPFQATITNEENYKYILIEHADQFKKQFLLRGSENHSSHKGIWKEFIDNEISPFDEHKYKVRGGGVIINSSDKVLIGGKSNTFGPSNSQIVEKIMKSKYPNKQIIIEKEDWNGSAEAKSE